MAGWLWICCELFFITSPFLFIVLTCHPYDLRSQDIFNWRRSRGASMLMFMLGLNGEIINII